MRLIFDNKQIIFTIDVKPLISIVDDLNQLLGLYLIFHFYLLFMIILMYFWMNCLQKWLFQFIVDISFMKLFRNNSKKVFCIYTILYSLFSVLFIIGNWIHSDVLRALKIFPFLILIYTLLGFVRNKNILKVLIGVIFGAIGDIVLEYWS